MELLEECNLINRADVGVPSVLEVACTFKSPASFEGYASFDQIEIDQNQNVIAAKFRKLIRK